MRGYIRKLLRGVQEFVPGVASTTRELALESLRTNRWNYICPYHHEHKDRTIYDGSKEMPKRLRGYKLVGIPKKRDVTASRVKGLARSTDEDYIEAREGCLNCGCRADVALLDYMFWKNWKLVGTVNGKEIEDSMGTQILGPRERAFVVQDHQNWTGLRVDDLYNQGQSKEVHWEKVLEKQTKYVLGQWNDAREDLGMESVELMMPVPKVPAIVLAQARESLKDTSKYVHVIENQKQA